MKTSFEFLAQFLANAFNYNHLISVAIGLCLNETLSLVVTSSLGLTSMLHAPLVLVVADIALSVFLFTLFYRIYRICNEEIRTTNRDYLS